MASSAKSFKSLPWYGWALVPFVLPVVLVVGILLGILAAISIPYYFIYPDHHRHIWDSRGTTHQRALLASWRLHYAHLGFFGRIRRAFIRVRRRCGLAA
jgi:hypothetical protein